jgi:hypothetical protein
MDWKLQQARYAQIAILKPHSPEWQTVRAKLLADGKYKTVAFMDYQATQGKGWNVRGLVQAHPRLNRKTKLVEKRRKLHLRVIRGGLLGDRPKTADRNPFIRLCE